MATLEDKLLGEKLQYYCSSSESEGEESATVQPAPESASKTYSSKKGATNTGPKGVVQDWRRFKQLEVEKREEQQKEKQELAKKFTLTCQSAKDEEQEDEELNQLMSDSFLQEYARKRMQEMMEKKYQLPTFGRLIHLADGSSFLDAVDKENENVTVIVHIYDKMLKECERLNKCLDSLAVSHPNVKFCKMLGSTAGVSEKFEKYGIPALLVYKGGNLLGSFVSLSNEFGCEFVDSDVEGFLVEHGMLSDKSLVPPGMGVNDDDSDSD